MTILLRFQRGAAAFLRADSAAVTVDWVVLTAAVTGLGLAAASAVRTGTAALGSDVETTLTNASVASLGCLGENGGPAGFSCYAGPTIVQMTGGFGFGNAGACSMTQGGVMTCTPSSMTMVEQYQMSDGATYAKTTLTVGGATPVVTWTDGSGQAVETPPPV